MELILSDPISSQRISGLYLDNGIKTIGRSSDCDIVVPARFSSISGIHATLGCSGDSLEIMDGNGQKPSANGTFVNGKRVPQETWSKITKGDQVSLGIPGATGSLSLIVSQEDTSSKKEIRSLQSVSRGSVSSHPTSTSRSGNLETYVHSSGHNTRHLTSNDTVSARMKIRLCKIDQYLANGYSLTKLQFAPVFLSQDERKHAISILNNPAGFSWVGFFFAFAVCTQIREWSYFYVLGISSITLSILSILFKRDLTFVADFGIAIMYGIYFPYLRHMALSQAVPEFGKGRSIIQGILLSVLVVVPGSLLIYFFFPS